LKPGTRLSLSAQISSWHRRLGGILDSFWFFLVSRFSKPTPSEDKLSQRTQDTTRQRIPRVSAARFVESHKLLLELLGLPLALLTIGGFYLSYAPKISVDPSDSLVSYNPLGTTFVLSNEGSINIHEVAVSAANLHMENSDPKTGFQITGPWEFTNVPKDATADILSAGHKMGLPYPRNFGFTAINNFTGGSFTFIVRYRPDWLPWRRKEIFPFEAIRTTDGKWVWKPVAQ